jgi:hypothetical protein
LETDLPIWNLRDLICLKAHLSHFDRALLSIAILSSKFERNTEIPFHWKASRFEIQRLNLKFVEMVALIYIRSPTLLSRGFIARRRMARPPMVVS